MKKSVFLLADPRAPTPEEIAARRFYRSRFGRAASVSSFRDLPSLLERTPPAVLWWHCDAATDLPPIARDPEVITALRSFVENGGGLFLTLLAARYVAELGFEATAPNVLVKGTWEERCWAPGTRDCRGIASVRGHPLLDGLGNGVFTWSPRPGDPFAGAWYDQQALPASGRVLAVERQYIRIEDRRRIAVEYRPGKGRILTIGSHFFFAHPLPQFRPHLERLAANGIAYLSAHPVPRRGSYWSFAPGLPEERTRHSPPVKPGDAPLPAGPAGPGSTRRPPAASDFDLGGRRILILGDERSGIAEVWAHPLRILSDLRLSFSVGGSEPQPADAVVEQATIRPGVIVRTHRCNGALIEESIFGDRDLPAGAARYRIESALPVTLTLSARVDLRVMWPLPAAATGTLHYGWDDGLQALRVTDAAGGGACLVGCGRRPDVRRIQAGGRERREIVLEMEYTLRPGDPPLTLAFAGSGEREAIAAYRRMVRGPDRRLELQFHHGRKILESATRIEGPDARFNDAYCAALLSTERFSADVPGVGSSLMAGYATTAHGWDGGHAVSGRPGYAWFFGRDSVWTSLALLGCGLFDPVRDVLLFLGNHQDPAGKILHEMTTSGFAHYDAADSTPLYVMLMGRYLAATGDLRFVRSQYGRLRRALAFCRSTDTDGDHLIENTGVGHGWVEGGKLFPVHTELYLAACWGEALAQAAYVARLLGDEGQARRCRKESREAGSALRRSFWNEETGLYRFAKNADGSFRSDETVLQAVAILFGLTDRKKDGRVLDRLASEQFSADWGVRMVPKESPQYGPAAYHEGSIWPLFTGWTSLAEFTSRRPLQGFVHAMGNLHLAWSWSAGNFPEVLDGERCVPAGVCAHQAWSGSMALQPFLEGMLGFRPDAPGGRLHLRPYFPPEWERAEARGLRIGMSSVTMTMRRRVNRTSFIFSAATARPLGVEFRPWFPCGTTIHALRVGSSVVLHDIHVADPEDVPPASFALKGEMRVTYEHSGGVAMVPPVTRPVPGASSSALRFIRDRWAKGAYEIVVEGMGGSEHAIDLIAGGAIRTTDNAEIVREDGERVTLRIRFDGPVTGGYVRKTVRTGWEF